MLIVGGAADHPDIFGGAFGYSITDDLSYSFWHFSSAFKQRLQSIAYYINS